MQLINQRAEIILQNKLEPLALIHVGSKLYLLAQVLVSINYGQNVRAVRVRQKLKRNQGSEGIRIKQKTGEGFMEKRHI